MKIVKRDNFNEEVKDYDLFIRSDGNVYEYKKGESHLSARELHKREDLYVLIENMDYNELETLRRKCTDLHLRLDEVTKKNKQNESMLKVIRESSDEEILIAVKIIKLLGE